MSNDTALLIIDVQAGMFDPNDPVYNGDELLTRLAGLIGKARAANIPVIYVQHNEAEGEPLDSNGPGWPIHPAIAPKEGETVIQKWHPDSFQETNLQAELEAKGIKNLIIAGIQTEMCVDTTSRRAYSLGYKVTLVKDAHSTWNTKILTAPQIIAHHNQNLGGMFVTLKEEAELQLA